MASPYGEDWRWVGRWLQGGRLKGSKWRQKECVLRSAEGGSNEKESVVEKAKVRGEGICTDPGAWKVRSSMLTNQADSRSFDRSVALVLSAQDQAAANTTSVHCGRWTTDNRLCNLSDPTLKVLTPHSGNFDGRHKIWDRCDAVRDTDACTPGRTLSTEWTKGGRRCAARVLSDPAPGRHGYIRRA